MKWLLLIIVLFFKLQSAAYLLYLETFFFTSQTLSIPFHQKKFLSVQSMQFSNFTFCILEQSVWTSLLLWKVLWKNGTMERLIVPVKASTHKEVKWGLEPSAWTMSSGCFLILFIQGGLDEMTRQSLDSDCS